LVRLVRERLPAEYAVTSDSDAWPLVGAALVSRATTTLENIFRLQWRGREGDAGTMARSLLEHVIHLAWLGADSSQSRLGQWRRHDLQSRLTADTDARKRGIQLFTDAQRAALAAQIEALPGRKRLTVERLAQEADEHWAGHLPGLGSSNEAASFRGFYAFVYRHYSGAAHASYPAA
jgi:uncharacterized protein DUF5677